MIDSILLTYLIGAGITFILSSGILWALGGVLNRTVFLIALLVSSIWPVTIPMCVVLVISFLGILIVDKIWK